MPAGRAGKEQEPIFQDIASSGPGEQGGFFGESAGASRTAYLMPSSLVHLPSALGGHDS